MRGFGDGAVGIGFIGGGDDQPDVVEPVGLEAAVEVDDAARFDQCGDFEIQRRRAHSHLGTGGQQGGDLAPGHGAATHH